jgi:hypothetical protein
MRYIVFALALLMPVTATAACYDADQAAAEAAVRIHSEIMVTALTCQYSQTTGDDLRNVYVAFGQKHNARLRRAEQTLIDYYQKQGRGGVAGLDKLRTMLGNEYAERIAIRDPKQYCAQMEDNVVAVGQWTPAEFEQAILRAAAASPATQPVCSQVAQR